MTKTTVIHHNADFDGLFCREIARKFIPDAELIGWDYGQPKIPVPTGNFYILDLSPECLACGASYAFDQCVWIDHHKSAIEKFNPLISGYRIDGVAACRLAWQWFNQGLESYPVNCPSTKQPYFERKVMEPLAVCLAGEYDIWDKRDPNAELFQHGLRSRELTPEIWARLLGDAQDPKDDETVLDLLNGGEVLQYARTKENESVIKTAGFTCQWEGLTFLCCNAARYNSQLFTAGVKPEHDALLGFAWRGDKWTVSLYHAPGKEHHDLSLIAVKHGGGGHRGACGFLTKTLPFLEPQKPTT